MTLRSVVGALIGLAAGVRATADARAVDMVIDSSPSGSRIEMALPIPEGRDGH